MDNTILTVCWIGLFFILLMCEITTPISVVAVWFLLPCLICAVLAYLKVSFIVQIIVFAVGSFLCMLITCPLIKKKNKLKDDAVSDKLVGLIDKEAILEEEIKGIETGLVRVSGIPWRCVSKNKNDIPAGTLVKVIEAKGNLLVVKEVGE